MYRFIETPPPTVAVAVTRNGGVGPARVAITGRMDRSRIAGMSGVEPVAASSGFTTT
jgi:hypothetical protein